MQASPSSYHSLRTTMVDTQVRPSDVTKFPVIDALLAIPREAFVPEDLQSVAYADAAVSIAPGRELMEARTFAKLLDALDLKRSEAALIIGCGLGYSAAVLGHMLDVVVAVEEEAAMAEDAEAALGRLDIYNAAVVAGPHGQGAPKAGPYDVIVIEGGVQQVPASLIDQLKDGGRIAAVFVDGPTGEARVGYKSDGRMSWRRAFNATLPILPGFEEQQTFAL